MVRQYVVYINLEEKTYSYKVFDSNNAMICKEDSKPFSKTREFTHYAFLDFYSFTPDRRFGVEITITNHNIIVKNNTVSNIYISVYNTILKCGYATDIFPIASFIRNIVYIDTQKRIFGSDIYQNDKIFETSKPCNSRRLTYGVSDTRIGHGIIGPEDNRKFFFCAYFNGPEIYFEHENSEPFKLSINGLTIICSSSSSGEYRFITNS